MWEVIVGAVLVVGVLLGGGWLICCHANFYRQWSGMVRKKTQGIKDAWDALPKCPDPPPPPMRVRGPLKPGEEMVIEAGEIMYVPPGLNCSTCAKSLKVKTVSLEDVLEFCLMESWKRHLPWPVIITDIVGFNKLAESLPEPLTPPVPMTPYTGTFCDVPVKQYPFEGLARAAAIVAEADGYDVMLFLSESDTTKYADDKSTDEMDAKDESDKRLTESKKSAER